MGSGAAVAGSDADRIRGMLRDLKAGGSAGASGSSGSSSVSTITYGGWMRVCQSPGRERRCAQDRVWAHTAMSDAGNSICRACMAG